LFRVGVAGGEPVQIADLAHIDSFVVGPRGRRAYLVRRAIDAPRELWSVDLAGSEPPVRLTFHNRAFEDEVDLRPAERVQVEVAPGRTVELFLILPHGFDPEKRYPAILNVHGGPQSQWSDAFRGDWQMYPGSGYVLAFPNPSGSTGYGQAFVEEISGDWGGQVYRDLMAVTDWLASRPYVDPDRIGAMGWSYGGYMMNWFQASTDRYRALACMMGLFDLRSFHLTTEELWFPEWDLGGRPWDSEQYERWNPASRIESFETPMLIVTGERDFRVPYTQSLMAFTALRRRGVPARLVVMPDSGHWPGWTDMALYYTAHLDWFHRWLGGDPPPWSVEAYADNAVFDRETGERIDVKGDADGVTCLDGESP
jgi:dipeptidyl aminopeptidase/acylaminoacyl peptidase